MNLVVKRFPEKCKFVDNFLFEFNAIQNKIKFGIYISPVATEKTCQSRWKELSVNILKRVLRVKKVPNLLLNHGDINFRENKNPEVAGSNPEIFFVLNFSEIIVSIRIFFFHCLKIREKLRFESWASENIFSNLNKKDFKIFPTTKIFRKFLTNKIDTYTFLAKCCWKNCKIGVAEICCQWRWINTGRTGNKHDLNSRSVAPS